MRLSGPQAVRVVAALVEPGGARLIEQRGFTGRALELKLDRARLPVWVNVYRAPRSYTRQDIVELFVCGSPPVLGLLSTTLLAARSGGEPAVRWARPGEFTLRAFLSGRIDLSQAESVAGLIEARGESEARAARRGLRGELRDRLDELAGALTEIIALLEAALDFPDEDLPQIAPEVIRRRVDAAREQLDALRSSCGRLSGADGTLRVVLAGFPNAGKSTLLNAILRREAAIATAVPGTTRDPVRGVTVHQGRRIEWVDLAGTRSAGALTSAEGAGVAAASVSDPASGAAGENVSEVFGEDGDDVIWRIVRRLSKAEVEAADVLLWVIDPLVDVDASLSESRRLSGKCLLRVVQKSDLLAGSGEERGERFATYGPVHLVSAHDDDGVAALIDAVFAVGSGPRDGPRGGEPPRFLVSAHQQAALDAAGEAMTRARAALALGYEFVATDMRDVLRALEDLTGRVTNDAILDHVFSRFCIGK